MTATCNRIAVSILSDWEGSGSSHVPVGNPLLVKKGEVVEVFDIRDGGSLEETYLMGQIRRENQTSSSLGWVPITKTITLYCAPYEVERTVRRDDKDTRSIMLDIKQSGTTILSYATAPIALLGELGEVTANAFIPKPKPVPFFGSPIHSLVRRTEQGEFEYPKWVRCAFEIVKQNAKEEGIFRLSGSAQKIIGFKNAINEIGLLNCHNLSPDFLGADIHDITGLLKLWFRELPEPLLTYDLYEYFLAIPMIEDSSQDSALKGVLKKLPETNYVILNALMDCLSEVSRHVETNMMTPSNLAIVFGPTIMGGRNGAFDMKQIETVTSMILYWRGSSSLEEETTEPETIDLKAATQTKEDQQPFILSLSEGTFQKYEEENFVEGDEVEISPEELAKTCRWLFMSEPLMLMDADTHETLLLALANQKQNYVKIIKEEKDRQAIEKLERQQQFEEKLVQQQKTKKRKSRRDERKALSAIDLRRAIKQSRPLSEMYPDIASSFTPSYRLSGLGYFPISSHSTPPPTTPPPSPGNRSSEPSPLKFLQSSSPSSPPKEVFSLGNLPPPSSFSPPSPSSIPENSSPPSPPSLSPIDGIPSSPSSFTLSPPSPTSTHSPPLLSPQPISLASPLILETFEFSPLPSPPSRTSSVPSPAPPSPPFPTQVLENGPPDPATPANLIRKSVSRAKVIDPPSPLRSPSIDELTPSDKKIESPEDNDFLVPNSSENSPLLRQSPGPSQTLVKSDPEKCCPCTIQ